MKAVKILFILAGILTVLSSCKKDTSDTSGTPTNVLFHSDFTSLTDLSVWSQSSGGEAIIDSSAVKFTNISDCYHFETINPIPVQKGKTYELRIKGKVNESLSGDPMLCAGDFIVWVVQGSTNVISDSFGNHPAWTQRSFSFEATSSASVKIEFLIGTMRGAWIDSIDFLVIQK
ncbi:MAG: hypothetical protein NTW10_09790 [Bacteroidetes bacterium]|nr:hypothetical protein [Bacteroidota bacterium]